MQSAKMELPADLALIKELVQTSDYKFLLPAAQHKLQNIKVLSGWFSAITKMLARFPDTEAFLFGTVASLNRGSELSLRTVSVKLEEKGVKLERATPEVPSHATLAASVKEEHTVSSTLLSMNLLSRSRSRRIAICNT